MLKHASIIFIKTYKRFLSPAMFHCCKFYPSCSSYAVEALEKKNFLKATTKIFWRLLRCNPFSAGGYDPVK